MARSIAVAILCKTPGPGRSKTRLSPPLALEDCAAISACFIADLARTLAALEADGDVRAYAVYTPIGSEAELVRLLPSGMALVAQRDGDFGERLEGGLEDLLALGHAGAILVNSDSPTMPRAILRNAVDALLGGDRVVLCPAADGGYALIGVAAAHPELFVDIPWSTGAVYRLTLERANAAGLEVVSTGPWYDVDDAATLELLERELAGERPWFASSSTALEPAPRTRAFLARHRTTVRRA